MRMRLRHGLGVGVAVVVAVVAVPSSAYALGAGSSTQFKSYNNSNLCMGVAGGNSHVQDGTAIITWTCTGSADQTWVLSLADPSQPNGPYLIENSVATSECLSVAAKSTAPGARLVLWHCKSAADNQDQQWSLSGDRQSPYTYMWNSNSGLVATALSGNNGAAVAQEPQGGTWFPVDAWLTA
jgi:Ricin-type beta-trefoil lectin domain